MDTRPVLGLSEVRPSFLVDVPPAQSRENKARGGAGVTISDTRGVLMARFELDDDLEDDIDEDDDDFNDDDSGGEDEEDEEDEDGDVETWQVSELRRSR